MVEHFLHTEGVTGSNPVSPTIFDLNDNVHLPGVSTEDKLFYKCDYSQPHKRSWQSDLIPENLNTANMVLTLKDAEKEFGISARTLRYWINGNELQAIQVPYGKKIRYFLDLSPRMGTV